MGKVQAKNELIQVTAAVIYEKCEYLRLPAILIICVKHSEEKTLKQLSGRKLKTWMIEEHQVKSASSFSNNVYDHLSKTRSYHLLYINVLPAKLMCFQVKNKWPCHLVMN